MLFRVILPLVFVFLWSSAFLAAKVGVQFSTPFAMLLIRFVLVSLVFAAMLTFVRTWRRGEVPRSLEEVPRVPNGARAHGKAAARGAGVQQQGRSREGQEREEGGEADADPERPSDAKP